MISNTCMFLHQKLGGIQQRRVSSWVINVGPTLSISLRNDNTIVSNIVAIPRASVPHHIILAHAANQNIRGAPVPSPVDPTPIARRSTLKTHTFNRSPLVHIRLLVAHSFILLYFLQSLPLLHKGACWTSVHPSWSWSECLTLYPFH